MNPSAAPLQPEGSWKACDNGVGTCTPAMMIKNKPRNASKRASRVFFTTPWPGTSVGPDSIKQLTAKLHDNGIPA
jgi:hypothetical protein